MEGHGGLAAALEVPGALEDALEDEFLEGSVGDEEVAEAGFEFGEFFLLAFEDDEAAGGESVAEVVLRGGGFSFVGSRAGR